MSGYRHLFFWFKFCNHVYEKRLLDWLIQLRNSREFGLANRYSVGIVSDSV